MAFFAERGQFARDMWPYGMGRPLVEREEMLGVPTWRVLPTEYDALCDRVAVHGAGTKQPRVILTGTGYKNEERVVQLSLRVQGVVADVSLGSTGNWHSTPDHIPKAAQFLTLHAVDDMDGLDPERLAACRDAFRVQRTGILHIEAIVRNALGQRGGHNLGRGGKINLRRRVFTKVRPGDGPKGVRLSKYEDPAGKIKKLEREWVIDHRVKTAVQSGGGNFVLSNPLAIRRGDFVDVAALVSVVVRRGRHGSDAEVMLAPLEVVRLRTRSEVKTLLRGPRLADGPGEADGALDVVTGFEMGGTMFPDDIEHDMEDVE